MAEKEADATPLLAPARNSLFRLKRTRPAARIARRNEPNAWDHHSQGGAVRVDTSGTLRGLPEGASPRTPDLGTHVRHWTSRLGKETRQFRYVRLHRALLQPSAQTLRTRLRQPTRLWAKAEWAIQTVQRAW